MFELLLWSTAAVIAAGILLAWDGSRDIFHPMMYLGPMMAVIYAYMPLRMFYEGQLAWFFTDDQLLTAQAMNLAGVVAVVAGCLSAGCQRRRAADMWSLSEEAERRLVTGGIVFGALGVAVWSISIINVGGFTNAFSHSYSGGWDDSGYIRDTSIFMLAGILLLHAAVAFGAVRALTVTAGIAIATPWLVQAILTSRRGPTFLLSVMAGAAWYLYRNRRPPVVLGGAVALMLGYAILFLVVNRNQIHLGSEFEFTTDVTSAVESPHTGNEYVYGNGTMLSAYIGGHHYWARRWLAQVMVRPIPSSIWPTKYEDFGVPELLHNAGTAEGIGDTLGWAGAPGSAPGIIADSFIELRWGYVVFLAFAGWVYGKLWNCAVSRGGPWLSYYTIAFALSIYFVMQTMEAVIFRAVLLSLPVFLTWRWATMPAQDTEETSELRQFDESELSF